MVQIQVLMECQNQAMEERAASPWLLCVLKEFKSSPGRCPIPRNIPGDVAWALSNLF